MPHGLIGQELPPFLLNTEPMEPDELPLQVALLTMEIASLRTKLAALIDKLEEPPDGK